MTDSAGQRTQGQQQAQAQQQAERPVEPHWGDPNRAQIREVTTTGEKITAFVILSLAALALLSIEVAYLHQWLHIGSVALPFPWTLLLAFFGNQVLLKTGLLWTQKRAIAAIPLWIWLVAWLGLLLWSGLPFGGDEAVGSSIRTLLLPIVGMLPLLTVRSRD